MKTEVYEHSIAGRHVWMGVKDFFLRKFVRQRETSPAAPGDATRRDGPRRQRVRVLYTVFARSHIYENDLGRRYRAAFSASGDGRVERAQYAREDAECC